MQQDLEVKVPFCYSGLPLEVNNPVLINFAIVKVREVKRKPKIDKFLEYFREATGFSCNIDYDIEGNLPFSSYYVYVTRKLVDLSINKCEIPMNENDVRETLEMIDDAMFDSRLIRALRKAQELNSPILYRDGEDPVPLSGKEVRINLLTSFPLPKPRFLESSLIHLAGILPVEISKDSSLIQFENGLWSSLYGLPYPMNNNWKWIWDLKWASLIELLN
ncbi:MAG: hypothetical protein OWQ47_00040 [Acidianus infernus]|nr:hypothetical protein [Acidianus infernus]